MGLVRPEGGVPSLLLGEAQRSFAEAWRLVRPEGGVPSLLLGEAQRSSAEA